MHEKKSGYSMEIKLTRKILINTIICLLLAFGSMISFVANKIYGDFTQAEEEVFQLNEKIIKLTEDVSQYHTELEEVRALIYKAYVKGE
jgi:cell division protein FtsL